MKETKNVNVAIEISISSGSKMLFQAKRKQSGPMSLRKIRSSLHALAINGVDCVKEDIRIAIDEEDVIYSEKDWGLATALAKDYHAENS